MDIDLVVNLKLPENVLLEKCLGRRICDQCGKNFNVASINVKGENGNPDIKMAPLPPPPRCASKLITRSDDTEAIVKERLRIYNDKVLLYFLFIQFFFSAFVYFLGRSRMKDALSKLLAKVHQKKKKKIILIFKSIDVKAFKLLESATCVPFKFCLQHVTLRVGEVLFCPSKLNMHNFIKWVAARFKPSTCTCFGIMLNLLI